MKSDFQPLLRRRKAKAGEQRILVRGTNWLGDAVMTTPALLRLREKFPDAHIALLTPEKLRELWLQHPALNETIPFAPNENVFSVGKRLRAGRFDLALILPNSPRSAMEPWVGCIPRRIGYARPWRDWLLTLCLDPRTDEVKMHKRSVDEIKKLVAADVNRRTDRVFTSAAAKTHQIHDYLNLVAALGANPEPLPPQLVVTPKEVDAATEKFGLENLVRPILGLCPGAEYGPAKRWPVDRFTAAAREIQQRTNCTWLVFGGPADKALADRIESTNASPPSAVLNLAGKTSLRELMALLKFCQVVLTNDTGPMHVAAALNTPVVVPYGSTSPELTGPGLPGNPLHWLLQSNASCSPCFLRECPIDFRCLNHIPVRQVVEAVLSAI
jgi:heptosyltransferase II